MAMMMGGGRQPPPPKADGGRALQLTAALGINWDYDHVVFDMVNPHPEFGMLPAEYVFVTSENEGSFSRESPVTRGLQEVIVIYSGSVRKNPVSSIGFEPLLATTTASGVLAWEDFVDEGGLNFFSMQQAAQPKRDPFRRMDMSSHVMAARVKSEAEGAKVNAIFVSDIDMISDFFFQERSSGNLDIEFDNVTFVLNAVDVLAGDEQFIDLRSRRAKHRTLKRLDEEKSEFLKQASEAEKKADERADAELARRREELGKRLKAIQEDQNLDPIAKGQMIQAAQQAEQQRLSRAEAQIEQEKNNEIRKNRMLTNRMIRSLEARTRAWSVWLPPIPAILIGLVVMSRRGLAEKRSVGSTRRRDHN